MNTVLQNYSHNGEEGQVEAAQRNEAVRREGKERKQMMAKSCRAAWRTQLPPVQANNTPMKKHSWYDKTSRAVIQKSHD